MLTKEHSLTKKIIFMRKIYLAWALLLSAIGVQAQEYNLFPASVVDENGWLWFNSQEIVDQYVGVCNEDDYKVDPEGKIIQMVYADQVPSYPPTTVDPDAIGYGKGGELGADGYKKGAIILPAASASNSPNGGGIVLCLPSCSTFSINVSCSGSIYCQLLSTDKAGTMFSDYEVRKAYSMFNKFAGAGNTTVTGLEKQTNGYNKITIKSDKPVYAYFRNITNKEVYIHGIKVTTPKQETAGIANIQTQGTATQEVYTIDGVKVGNTLKGQKQGLYIVKQGNSIKKVIK
jgi:hypothetical protein